MTKETITLSQRELDRVWMMDAVIAKRLRQREAARQLGRSVRQVKRLVRRYREAGPRGLVSGHRGKTPGNAKAPSVRQAVLLHLCAETLRRWMVADGLWQPKQRRKARIHPC